MPGTIRLIDTQGEIRDVPTESAASAIDSGWRVPTTSEELARTTAQAAEETYGGVGGAVKAGGAALARGLSVGLLDAAARLIGGDDAAIALEGYRDANPGISIGGEVVGAVAPALISGGATLPAGAANLAGRGVARAAGGGLRGALAGGAVEGVIGGVGQTVSDVALSTEPIEIERVAASLSSNVLFGAGAGAVAGGAFHGLGRALSRSKDAVDSYAQRAAAIREAPDDIPGDLPGIRAARDAEVERLAGEATTQRAALRAQAADDVISYRDEVKAANPWLAVADGEDAKRLTDAHKTLRRALDDPRGLRDNPASLAKPLRIEEQALESTLAKRDEILQKLDEVNAKIADDVEALAAEATTPNPDIPDFERLDAMGVDYLETTIPAQQIIGRGYYELPGSGLDPVKMGRARKAIAEGQRDAIKLNVSPTGKITVTDGRHRLAAAIEENAPIKVKWAAGFEPAADDVLHVAQARTVPLTGKAARRYAQYSGVKLEKGKALQVAAEEAVDFVRAIREGEVRGQTQQALDAVQGLLDRNRALQAQIRDAVAPMPPKVDLKSPRLDALDAARDVLQAPAPERSFGQKLLGGSVFGAISGAVSGVPVIGSVLGPLLGAAASDALTGAASRKMGSAARNAKLRMGRAMSSVLGTAEKAVAKAEPVAPLVATRILGALRYSDRKDKDEPTKLPALFKRRTDEIKEQLDIAPDGSYQMRPDARAKMAARFDGIRPADPIAADRLEEIGARGLTWLGSQIPRRPDVFSTAYGPDRWQPSGLAMRSWARKAAAVDDPISAFERVADGSVTPEDAAAIRAVYPELYAEFTQTVAAQLPELQKALPYKKRLALGIFTGVPVDPSMDPRVLRVLQDQFPAEPGSAGGTQAPLAQPQFGSIQKSPDQPTPAQARGADV